MQCPRCQHENRPDAAFCLECRTAIARIPPGIRGATEIQPTLDAIAKTAARLCDAKDAMIWQVEGDQLRLVAKHGRVRTSFAPGELRPISRGTFAGRAVVDRKTIHIRDLAVAVRREFKELASRQRVTGMRTVLATPLLRDGVPLGVISIRRTKVRPFTAKQIALLRTFADQAAMAIEKARISQELQARNRDLTEALEQQTATSEVLRIISSSPTDLQPVMDAVAEKAARLCGVDNAVVYRSEGDILRPMAVYGRLPATEFPLSRGVPSGRAVLDRVTVHVPEVAAAEDEYPDAVRLARHAIHRAVLAAPLLRKGEGIGTITIRRDDPGPFSDRQVKLLETFAAQAVIAIENVRLFTELQEKNRALTQAHAQAHAQVTEALDQQTATSEILRVISSSPTDAQPVFDAIVESAVRLCSATVAGVYRFDGERLEQVAAHNSGPGMGVAQELFGRAPSRDTVAGLAVLDSRVIYIEDALKAGPPGARRFAELLNFRGILGVPMLRDGRPIGSIVVCRSDIGFPSRQIELLQTFADQAVIAIENVRLFQELEARNRELTESLEQQTATSEILKVISRSPTDVQPVFQAIAASATRLCDAANSGVFRFDGALIHLVAHHNWDPQGLAAVQRAFPLPPGRGSITARAILTRAVAHADIAVDPEFTAQSIAHAGFRTSLSVPMLRDGQPIGAITVTRMEPRPFSETQIALLQTFATQSVLAIQNARLFSEIADKSRQLEAASQHKSEFLANMSHELRTPLNAILGFNEMILGQIYGEVPADLRVPLADIQDSGKHLLRLINNILDLSKIEAGRMELALGDYSVQDTVERVRGSLRPLAAEKGLEFVATVSADIPLAYGDGGRITQCLMNLAGNALKFTRQGRVEIGVELQGDSLVYRVADTGIGIAPDKIESVFAEFRQGDATVASEFGGTGLGLSITKKFVEMHGGRIWVESEVGKGSTFFFAIPLRLAEGKPA